MSKTTKGYQLNLKEDPLTDEELMLLEQLCYLDKEVCDAAGLKDSILYSNNTKKTVGKILSSFTEQNLANLRALDDEVISGGVMEASEWADIIEAIQNNPKLANLTLADVKENSEGKPLAMCYTDGVNKDTAVVAFKGTTGYGDWYDNFQGLYETDTERQKAALDYINQLPYTFITVVGHSKGGNYVQYVCMLSEKVIRGVSMDGQGFSGKFIRKYRREILKNAGKVKNYAAGTDFVNQLLYSLPGVRQIHVEGNGINDVAQNHSPNSLLSIDEGEVTVSILADGAPEEMGIIRDLSIFIMETANEEDKKKMADLLGNFTGKILGDKQTGAAIKDLLSDQEALAMLLAYTLKYMDTYDLTGEDFGELLTTLGMNDSMVNTIVDIVSNLQGKIKGQSTEKILLDSLKEFVRVTTSLDFLEAPEAYLDGLILKTKEIYDSIPDIEVESLNTGERKLGEAMAAVLSGEIKVNYSSFVLTYSLLRRKADEMEAEYQKLQNALDYLTEDWIGEDQKAFVKAGIGFQKELNDRVKEVRDMADKLEMASESFREKDQDVAEMFSEDTVAYGTNLQNMQDAIAELGR